jgi:hypothetical protein
VVDRHDHVDVDGSENDDHESAPLWARLNLKLILRQRAGGMQGE